MRYNDNIFVNQYPLVVAFVQHLAYYRAAKASYNRLGMTSPFWTATIDAHIMMASIYWCKVFGSYGPTNPTHWTKTPGVDEQTLQDAFRMQVLSAVGISQQQWTAYHKSMRDFRDKYVAHHEIGFSAPVPDFDTALNVAVVYETWVRDLLKPDVLEDQPLRIHFDQWVSQASAVSESAMKASKGKE